MKKGRKTSRKIRTRFASHRLDPLDKVVRLSKKYCPSKGAINRAMRSVALKRGKS
jgi:hypothetical protein